MNNKSFHLLAVRLLLPTSFFIFSNKSDNLCSTINALLTINEDRNNISSHWLERNLKLIKYNAMSKLMLGFYDSIININSAFILNLSKNCLWLEGTDVSLVIMDFLLLPWAKPLMMFPLLALGLTLTLTPIIFKKSEYPNFINLPSIYLTHWAYSLYAEVSCYNFPTGAD